MQPNFVRVAVVKERKDNTSSVKRYTVNWIVRYEMLEPLSMKYSLAPSIYSFLLNSLLARKILFSTVNILGFFASIWYIYIDYILQGAFTEDPSSQVMPSHLLQWRVCERNKEVSSAWEAHAC